MQMPGSRWHFRRVLCSLALGAIVAAALSAWSGELSSQVGSGDILRHIKQLASEEYTGRGVDTPGIKLARDYIAAEFAKYGLKPGGDNGTYLQGFDVAVGVTVNEPTSLALGDGAPLKFDADWIPLGFSTSDKAEADVAFVGYGITAKDYGYDDYEGVDVKNKIVVVLRYEPPPKDDKSPFRKLPDASTHATLRAKANNARAHGAAGMILVDLNASKDDQAELLSTRNSLWRGGNTVIAAQVKRSVIEPWLDSRGVSLSKLKEKIDLSEKPASMPVANATINLQVTLQEDRQRTENVVAILDGGNPSLAAENIVIGAHYDHLGRGYFGARERQSEGQIHPGADDNASGTAAVLDLARRMSQLSAKPARTIVFVAFSGEELGLYGSRAFVERAPFIKSTKAMVNLDMVGRLRDDRVTVFGTRTNPGFSKIVRERAEQLGLQVQESDGVGRSDHMSFYNRRIPVLHFFTGTHADYHRPSDTWDKINVEGTEKISDLVLVSTLEIANSKEPLSFASLPSRPPGEQSIGEMRLGTYLGVSPTTAPTPPASASRE